MKASPRIPLPKQDGFAAQRLNDAIERGRDQERARPADVVVTYSQPADSAASTVQSAVIWTADSRTTVKRIDVVAATAVAANATDYSNLQVNRRGGSLPQAQRLGRIRTDQQGYAAYEARKMELTNAEMKSGEALVLTSSKSGASGVQLPQLLVKVTLEVSNGT